MVQISDSSIEYNEYECLKVQPAIVGSQDSIVAKIIPFDRRQIVLKDVHFSVHGALMGHNSSSSCHQCSQKLAGGLGVL